MSVNIKYLTNGEKSIYKYVDASAEPIEVVVSENIEDINKYNRHYAPEEPSFASPDIAYMNGEKVGQFLYPDFPICKNPDKDYYELRCIGCCRYLEENVGDIDFRKCPYFDKEYKHVTDKTIELMRKDREEIERLMKLIESL